MADASQKESRFQGCGGLMSCISQTVGVGKRKHYTAQSTPTDVFHVKMYIHCAACKTIQAERGSAAKHFRPLSSVNTQLVCSLSCFFCYWQHAVHGKCALRVLRFLLRWGFWNKPVKFFTQFPPNSKSTVQISLFASKLRKCHTLVSWICFKKYQYLSVLSQK